MTATDTERTDDREPGGEAPAPNTAGAIYRWTEGHITARSMVLDLDVNPRIPSDAWVRKQLGKGYRRELLGTFVVSERIRNDGSAVFVILDGANRQLLMERAGDMDYAVPCQIFHGLAKREEARIAGDYNDRRKWTSVRVFKNAVTAGDPMAVTIAQILESNGWTVGTVAGNGIIKGVTPLNKFLLRAGLLEAQRAQAADKTIVKGSERWRAAVENGQADGRRVLDLAVQVYNTAYPSKPSSYASVIMQGLAHLILRDEEKIDTARLSVRLLENEGGQRGLLAGAQAVFNLFPGYNLADGVAAMAVRIYNKGLQGSSRIRLSEEWKAVA
jgi:hypothetical protein